MGEKGNLTVFLLFEESTFTEPARFAMGRRQPGYEDFRGNCDQ